MTVLAHGLGLDVIAEGAETAAWRTFLADIGGTTSQGYTSAAGPSGTI